ncbi:MAG TPA: endopeptidase La, partial [Pseudomonas sp.]|uniref:endopeptidase La n=1 Tax=Pseudomonas sp. TaxID=306 RepID=UPI002B49CEE2
GHIRAEVSLIDETDAAERESEVFVRTLLSQFEQYVQLGKKVPAEVLSSLNSIEEPGRLVDTMAAHMALKIEQKQEILEIIDLPTRVEHVLALLDAEIDLLQVEKRIRGRVKKQMERSQREYYLNEQMKAIQKELGDGDEGHNEAEELKKRIDAAGLPKDAYAKAQAELNKLKQMSPMSAEATVVRSYLDWLVQVPWKAQSKVRLDLAKAEEILDADHYGLEEVKERILEYLAVQKRVKKIRGPVLCLVGPPGVGKTSLAESIASATNRKFVRMALGGVRDEAEIRGHRRTYIGSMPGRLIQKMTKVGVRNPLFLLDEIDKMGSDMRGDPASALLEVLDPEQNHNFNDHYLEVDYDLSDVMFLCTSNSMNIPPALLDRMEVIRLPGYTEDEKINIAIKYLVPKQTKANGLKKGELEVEVSAIRDIIRYYTREAGVRGLERQIAKVCRKVVKESAGNKPPAIKVAGEQLEHYLGVRKFRYGLAEQQDQIGQVTGLAWTQVGGELLTIESVVIPGKGQLIKTGSLGDVMVESITAAQTVVRSRARSLGIAADFHEKHDVHIHMPEGATPKDGPSAGVGMCTALVSALTQIPVRADVAMTGEITLRGQVLAIGGLKEKLLAAHRGGIKTVIIPEENVRDLKEIPENIKQDLQIKPVKWIDEVLQIALQYAPEPLPDVAPEIVAKDEKRDSDAKERISTH